MSIRDFLECDIPVEDFEEGELTLFVHTRDNGILDFKGLVHNPVFSNGWLHVTHNFSHVRMNSEVRESEITHLSYFSSKVRT